MQTAGKLRCGAWCALTGLTVSSLLLLSGCGGSGGGTGGTAPQDAPLGTTWLGTTSLGTTWLGTTTLGTTTIGTTTLGTTAIGTTWLGTTTPPWIGTTWIGSYGSPWPEGSPGPTAKAVGGPGHVVALLTDGRIVAAGSNLNGKLGIGTGTPSSSSWVQVGADADWVDVAAGEEYTLALKADGTLWGWGNNADGQLTQNRTTVRQAYVPIQGAGGGWTSLVAGAFHAFGFQDDGTAWAWGRNQSGALGVGWLDYASFNPQSLGTGWRALSAGLTYFSLGIKQDGSLWAWGYNYYGQCGFGNTYESQWPERVGADRDWVAVAAGGYHSLGLKADGSVWAWGYSAFGQVGNVPNPDVPHQVGDDTDWVAVAAGSSTSYALKADGSIWGWGLGLGPGGTNVATPVRLSGYAPEDVYVAITTRPYLMGLRADGTLVRF